MTFTRAEPAAAGWRTSLHSGKGRSAACVQAGVAALDPRTGSIVLGEPGRADAQAVLRLAITPVVGTSADRLTRASYDGRLRGDTLEEADRLFAEAAAALSGIPEEPRHFFRRLATDVMAPRHAPFPLVLDGESRHTPLDRVREVIAYRLYRDLGWTPEAGWENVEERDDEVDWQAGARDLSERLREIYGTGYTGDRSGLRGGRAGHEIETGMEARGSRLDRFDGDLAPATRLVVSPGGTVSLVLDQVGSAKVVEFVTSANATLDGEVGTSRAQTIPAESEMFARLRASRPGQSLAKVFPVDAGYVLHKDAGSIRLGQDLYPGRLAFHITAGVPVIGVRDILRLALEHPIVPNHESVRHTRSAVAYGDTVAGRYLGLDPSHRQDLGAVLDEQEPQDPAMAVVRQYMSLVYTQVAAQIHGAEAGASAKRYAAIASRVSLARIRESLPRNVQDWLMQNHSVLAEELRARFRADNRDDLELTELWLGEEDEADIFAQEIGVGENARDHTVGQYFASAVRGDAAEIDPLRSLGVRSFLPGMDTSLGWREDLPLVPLELRSFGEKAGRIEDVTRWHELVAHRSKQADAAARRILGLPSPRLTARDMHAVVDVADSKVLGSTVDLQRFADIVVQEAAHRYRQGDRRAVLDVHVEGGGNQRRVLGGERAAEHKGTMRAGLVVDQLRQAVEAGLRSRRIPGEAVEYHVSTRGSRLTRSPFGQSETIEAAARRRQVVMWVTPTLGSPWQIASPAPVRRTSGPHVVTGRDGTQWASGSRSAIDRWGHPIPDDQRACVQAAAVVVLAVPLAAGPEGSVVPSMV